MRSRIWPRGKPFTRLPRRTWVVSRPVPQIGPTCKGSPGVPDLCVRSGMGVRGCARSQRARTQRNLRVHTITPRVCVCVCDAKTQAPSAKIRCYRHRLDASNAIGKVRSRPCRSRPWPWRLWMDLVLWLRDVHLCSGLAPAPCAHSGRVLLRTPLRTSGPFCPSLPRGSQIELPPPEMPHRRRGRTRRRSRRTGRRRAGRRRRCGRSRSAARAPSAASSGVGTG